MVKLIQQLLNNNATPTMALNKGGELRNETTNIKEKVTQRRPYF